MKLFDKIFRRKAIKKTATAEVPFFNSSYTSSLTGENISYKQLCDSYTSWVFTCIDKIAKTVATIPAELYYYKQKGSKVNNGLQIKAMVKSINNHREKAYYLKQNEIEKIQVFDHPLLDLFNHPNTIDTRMTLWMNIMIRLELAGYCGIYMPKGALGLPGELWAFPLTEGATLSINTDPKTIIKNFSYRDGSVNLTIERDEMLYIHYPNPSSPIYGQSPLLAQKYPYDIDNFLLQFVYSMLKNKSTFGNVFETDQELVGDQVTALQNLINTQYGGATHTGKPLVLHSGLKLDNNKLGSSLKDIMINEAATYASDRLITGYNMSPDTIGLRKEMNRSTAEVTDKKFYEECIRPRCMMIEEYFEKDLLPRYDEGLMLDFKIPVIAYRDLDLQERRENLSSGFTTINEERAKADGLEPVEWGDKPWLPFSLSQPGEDEPPQNVPQLPVDIDEPEVEPEVKTKAKAGFWTEAKKRKASEMFVKSVERNKDMVLNVITAHFRQQEQEVISILEDNWKSINGALGGFSKQKRRVWLKDNKAKLTDVNINVEEEAQELAKNFKPILTSIIIDVAETRLDEFNSTISFNINDKSVHQWLGRRLRVSSLEIEQTTHDKISAVLREGFQEGLSVTSMAERLKDEFTMFKQDRALTIARTETVSASNQADIEAIKQSGLDDRLRKFWLNEVDARDTHIEAGKRYDENNPIPVNEDFQVGQDTMIAPGNGSLPGENINCRCNMGYTEA